MRTCAAVLISTTLLASPLARAQVAGPWDDPPPLGKPAGRVVQVAAGDAGDLQEKVRSAGSGTTIVIPRGEYRLTATLRIGASARVRGVVLRGATGRRDDVVIRGPGMKVDSSATVPHCILVEQAEDVTIADLSVGDVWFHPISLQGPSGCDRKRIRNCRLFEAGEQFLKSNPARPDGSADAAGYSGCSDSAVEYCVFEYATTARHWYTEGIDVHAGHRWIVRDNLFRNIRGPAGASNVGGAIDFWNRSSGNLVERNLILDCAVGIRMGVVDREGYDDQAGSVVRNNFIRRSPGACEWADVGIFVGDSPRTKVLHNTVLLEGTYANAIEIRFPASRGGRVANNLTDGEIRLRDGATAELAGNVRAQPGWFVGPARGDLHLLRAAAGAIDAVAADPDVETDWDGTKRPAGRAADAGADEFKPGR